LEPGLLFRYKWTEGTYLHSQVKYWFPLGADPKFSGQVLGCGVGISHLWIDADNFAVIPTLEFVGWSVLDGQQSLPSRVDPVDVDGMGILNVYPGVRIVHDNLCDFGLFELGIASGFSVTERHWYDSLLRIDLRWSW
jgi:hypothetical protein